MAYKTFFFNFLKTDIPSKTLLTKHIFPKSFIRKRYKPNSVVVSSGAVCLIETDGVFLLKTLLQNKVGNYVFLQNKIFSHNKLKILKLKSFFFSENYLTKTTALSLFLKSLKSLYSLKISQLTVIICPVKGGYTVFSQGILGFLPKSHYKFYFFKKVTFFRFKFKKFFRYSLLKTTRFKNTNYFLFFFSVSKLLCILKKASLYYFLKKQKMSIQPKLKKYVKYKPAKTCFSFKFIFLSPLFKSVNRKKKKALRIKNTIAHA